MFSRSIIASTSSISRNVAARSVVASSAVRNGRYYSSTMHENDPEVLEREKDKSLSKTRSKSSPHQDTPGWNETLASASEAAVKADRHGTHPSDMIKTTVEYQRAERDSSEGDGTVSSTAFYPVDEVAGPLKGLGKNSKDGPELNMGEIGKKVGEISEKVGEKVGEAVKEAGKKLGQ
ncbi:hypothetical protein CPB83DRAFT_865408 [Crepidotus variabilis]|uniref:Uncharacterized protein n=1 Tax=Crepidotus variabilis TaxID=179855 RepID=A0A9P6E309_9AGAR|nr:hypothetical protein CPB83DRAFT_865408 [Crepidotus variabilis]